MYTVLENVRIVLAVLKAHNIHRIVLSPGGSNIPIVQGVQQDPFFTCYSVVDERSAMYFAIGLALQTGEPVATSCTTAQATRNYLPGLTEAFYKHVPILAITMSKHPLFVSQEYMQSPVQTSLPEDAVKKSFSLPRINDDNDRTICVRRANEAVLELTHHGCGPVQLNIEELDSETWSFDPAATLPDVRTIFRYGPSDKRAPSLAGKKVLLLIGEHRPFSPEETEAIEAFCATNNVFVYADSIANFHGKYALQANLTAQTMSTKLFLRDYKPDIVVTIGGLTGDYDIFRHLFDAPPGSFEVWRVAEDGNVVDTYKKLTAIFACAPIEFFRRYTSSPPSLHTYFDQWNALCASARRDLDLEFSNAYAAQQLHARIPDGSYMNFAILNSLRAWLWFPPAPSVTCFANVAAFGIDGCLSTLVGTSMETDQLCFQIIGDLAFFYDMNAIGIRHIRNNLRILLVNNNGGMEFKFGPLHTRMDVGSFTAADNHFKNARGWAETQGFTYLAAHDKNEFLAHVDAFVSPSDKPILLEMFTTPAGERAANEDLFLANRHLCPEEEPSPNLIKQGIKGLIGQDNARKLKRWISGDK
ncbi:MAG: 2-succinyl-5-enolpyruvyl-6-hydroxy-3-cyclohexene-1-carboxylate synthase [Kiritimatiellae bacterium]|nr:2-succinyl-5-enolpyruvyl-6-hydroxy-3-cyclohexene-1-carboxylate synthase [Kiritimatiellia bacterium]